MWVYILSRIHLFPLINDRVHRFNSNSQLSPITCVTFGTLMDDFHCLPLFLSGFVLLPVNSDVDVAHFLGFLRKSTVLDWGMLSWAESGTTKQRDYPGVRQTTKVLVLKFGQEIRTENFGVTLRKVTILASQLDYIHSRGRGCSIYFLEASYHESSSTRIKQVFVELQLNPHSSQHRIKKQLT